MRPPKWTHFLLALSAAIFFTSCGYYADGQRETVSLGSIQGDSKGLLTQTLIEALATSGAFQYQDQNGRLLLETAIISDSHTFIGYQFDRDPLSGDQIHRLIPNEGRQEVTVTITLRDTHTNQVIHGPTKISACTDYDFVDSGSLKDAFFTNQRGLLESSLSFSRGQLDSMRGAQTASLLPTYRTLATKIVEGISNISYDSK